MLPGCCVWSGSGSGSLLTHYPRHEVGGPSLEHCQWSQHSSVPTPTALYTSSRVVTIASIPPCVRCPATCVPLNITAHPHISHLVLSDQHFPENCDDASVCTLFRNGVGMHYWRYQVTLTTITQSCSVSGDCWVSVAGGG